MVENLVTARGYTRPKRAPRKQNSDFYPFGGGLNMIDSPLVAEPGQCQNALNYEIGFAGGYKRIGGYQYQDGRPNLSDPSYWRLPIAAKKKPVFTNWGSGGSILQNPYDQYTELVEGQTTGSMGAYIDQIDTGGYGENVLLHNNTMDAAGWNLNAGGAGIDAYFYSQDFRGYQWNTPDATVDFLPRWDVANLYTGVSAIEALSNPISVAVGDVLYVSCLARYVDNTSSKADGIKIEITNGVGNPFGGTGTPGVLYDVKRGTIVGAGTTDHWQSYGVTILGDGVMRLWAITKICSTADATLSVKYTKYREDPINTWISSYTQIFTIFFGAPMAVVWEYTNTEVGSPHNYCNGRDMDNTGGNFWLPDQCTITDGVTAWASGEYADFSRIVEASDTNQIHQFRPRLTISGDDRNTVQFGRGDKILVSGYAKYTAGQREGFGIILGFDANNKYTGQANSIIVGFDLANGIVATDIDGWNINFHVESVTLTEYATDIYYFELITDPVEVHGSSSCSFWMLEANGGAGLMNERYNGDGTSYIEMTGIQIRALPDPTNNQLKEVVTTDSPRYVNTGEVILVTETIGKNFEDGELLNALTHKPETAVAGDPVVEEKAFFGEARGPATKSDEPNATLDASYITLAELVAYKPDEVIKTGLTRTSWTFASNDGAFPTYVYSRPQRPPGSGPVRGVVFYDGFVYAFRDTEDQSACAIWKSSGYGWRRVDEWNQIIPFTAGTGAEPQPGDFVETSAGKRGYVMYVDTTSGTWGTDAAGNIYLKATDQVDNNDWVGTLYEDDGTTAIATITGTIDDLDWVSLRPGGKYEFREGNLYGDKSRKRLYWVNGEDSCYEFDGLYEAFAPISVGMTDDRPIHLAIHNYHLFLAYPSGSIQVSSDGDPHSFTVILGATEIAVGDRPTGFIEEVSNSLLIFTRNQTWVLNGNTRANFDLDDFNVNAGGHEWSLQRIGLATYFDDRGFTSLRQTSRGDSVDYQENTQSELIQPLVEDLLVNAKVTTSHLIKDENIYRCYFDDGRVVSIGFDKHNVAGHMPLEYPFTANVSYSGEDGNGNERIFVGTMDGDVFELERGTSFNGETITAFMRTVLYPSQTPGMFKRYSHARVDGTFDGPLTLAGRVEFDFDNPELNLGVELDFSNDSAGGYWDDMEFDSFIWDRTKLGNPQVKVEGEGTNCSIYLRSDSATDKSHTLRGMSMQWTRRRDDRRGL